jgi:hypothetical protein
VSYVIENASRIARVRVTAQVPVYGDLLKEGPICGYAISATVVRAFKGGTQPFKFLSVVPSDLHGFNVDYFVIAFPQSIAARDLLPLADLANPQITREVRCLLSQPNYVPTNYQTIWAFDKEADQRFGGEWLMGANRPDGLMCGFDPRKMNGGLLDVRTIDSGEGARYSINWSSVERFIQSEIANPNSSRPCTFAK